MIQTRKHRDMKNYHKVLPTACMINEKITECKSQRAERMPQIAPGKNEFSLQNAKI